MKKKINTISLKYHLEALEDPRVDRTKKHDLIDILVIAISAAICGADNWVDIEDFGKSKEDWFSSFLKLNHGIPSHDTFRRVFLLINPQKFLDIFMEWVKAVTKDTELEQICIDGKALRKSAEKGKSSSAIHMVNAWSTGAGLALGQLKSESKNNETKTVPKLLDLLDIKGCIVSTDALSCQIKIAEKIIEKDGDYLFALKDNQKYLSKRVQKAISIYKDKKGRKPVKVDQYTTSEEGHGRKETRSCTTLEIKKDCILGINPLKKWPKLNSIIEIKSERINKKTGEVGEETRYYISSARLSAEKFLKSVRGHWEVENKLHWVLDVVFKEDDSRARTGYGPENFSLLRQFALNLLKQETSNKSIRRKRNIAGWDEQFLLKILLGRIN